ncbi:MAG: Sir2 family NAD-dependent protein deacetylase [Opitutae bacterium]
MKEFEKYAEIIRNCDALLIGAGAGMGVDSGLPDFRGSEGFWKAYPPLATLGIKFEEMANPRWFRNDPKLAWGFYGHRFNLYHNTYPHLGHYILRKWADIFQIPSFVFTSNVDGHFIKAGWADQILECHGAIRNLQCMDSCGQPVWELKEHTTKTFNICPTSLRCESALPSCPKCGALARPNILMFSDFFWDPSIHLIQEKNLQKWMVNHGSPSLLIMEFGAGIHVPTVRSFCEQTWHDYACTMIRVNPQDNHAPNGVHTITEGALETLGSIHQILEDQN